MNKTWFFVLAALNLVFIGFLAKILDGIKSHAPVGYQDETGFHYGSR